MCIYIRHMPLCGHAPPTLLSYAACTAVFDQLMRITTPAAWTPAGRAAVPFALPAGCDPRPGNTWTLRADDYCGWECRNNAFLVLPRARDGGAGRGGGGVFGDDSDNGDDGDVAGGGVLPAYRPGDEAGRCATLGRDGGLSGGGGGGGGASAADGAGGQQYRKEPMVLGMPDARYGPGSERLGIGWRSE